MCANIPKTLTPVNTLPLRFLSYKLLVLLLFLTGQRVQTAHKFQIDDIKLTDDNVYIEVSELIKTSKPGCHIELFNLPAFKEDSSLFIVLVLKEYLNKTSMIRKATQLFLNCIKPYANVSKATLARCVKEVLKLSGIDIKTFKPQSIISTSTSAAVCTTGISIDKVLKSAGWSQESTFRKYYHKPVSKENYDDNYSIQLLKSTLNK